jgi:hypothetical protein
MVLERHFFVYRRILDDLWDDHIPLLLVCLWVVEEQAISISVGYLEDDAWGQGI